MYDYVRRAYGVNPVPGQMVRHSEIDRIGTIARERRSQQHYVMVRFDHCRQPLPCHPLALDYLPVPPGFPKEKEAGCAPASLPNSDMPAVAAAGGSGASRSVGSRSSRPPSTGTGETS